MDGPVGVHEDVLAQTRPVYHIRCRAVSVFGWRGRIKKLFLKRITDDEVHTIQRILNIEPGEFGRACKGKPLDLPLRPVQVKFGFEVDRT